MLHLRRVDKSLQVWTIASHGQTEFVALTLTKKDEGKDQFLCLKDKTYFISRLEYLRSGIPNVFNFFDAILVSELEGMWII